MLLVTSDFMGLGKSGNMFIVVVFLNLLLKNPGELNSWEPH